MPSQLPTRARKRLGRLGRDRLAELLADMDAESPNSKLRERVAKMQHLYAAVLLKSEVGERPQGVSSVSSASDGVGSAAEPDPTTAPDTWK